MVDRRDGRFRTLKIIGAAGLLVIASVAPVEDFSEQSSAQPQSANTQKHTYLDIQVPLGYSLDCENGPFSKTLTGEVRNGDRVLLDNYMALEIVSAGRGEVQTTPGLEGLMPRPVDGGVIYENDSINFNVIAEKASANRTNLIVDLSCIS